jgi:hypothetical protein
MGRIAYNKRKLKPFIKTKKVTAEPGATVDLSVKR